MVLLEGNQMMNRFVAVLAAFGLLLVTVPVLAHHAFAASYDSDKSIELVGTVTKVMLINPHSFIFIDVKNPDGTVAHWEVEGGAPNSLFRHGLKRDTLPVGSPIKVFGYQSKTGESKAVGAFLTAPDGSKIFMGGSAPGANGPAGDEAK
jgi:Family of unknown function (DUF6152)